MAMRQVRRPRIRHTGPAERQRLEPRQVPQDFEAGIGEGRPGQIEVAQRGESSQVPDAVVGDCA